MIAAFDNLLPDAEGELQDKIAARVDAAGKDVLPVAKVAKIALSGLVVLAIEGFGRTWDQEIPRRLP